MNRNRIIVLLLIFCAGCISQSDIDNLTGKVDLIVPTVREVVIAATGETDEKLEKVLTDVETVNEAVKEADTPQEAISKGIEASRPFNPYADQMNAVLGLVTILGGAFIRKQANDKKKVENRYEAAKIGLDKFRNDNPEKAKELYDDIGEARKAKKIA